MRLTILTGKKPVARSIASISLLSLFLAACGGAHENQPETSETEAVGAQGGDVASIGSFNLLRLGSNSKNTKRMARLIKSANYDVFAAVEIMTPSAARELTQAISEETGEEWRLVLSKRGSGEGPYKEYSGFYYRTKVVKPVSVENHYCSSEKARDTQYSSCIARDYYTNGKADFERDPFIARFNVRGTDMTLVAVHLYYGDNSDVKIERRKRELKALKQVTTDIEAKSASDVMVMGDFNLKIDSNSNQDMTDDFFESTDSSPSLVGLVKGPTTVGYSNYDHFIYPSNNRGRHISGSEKILNDFAGNWDLKESYRQEVSDHYPIRVQYRLK